MGSKLKIIVWYDRKIRLWTATYHDSEDYVIGKAGYGITKAEAVEDVEYQNRTFVNRLENSV